MQEDRARLVEDIRRDIATFERLAGEDRILESFITSFITRCRPSDPVLLEIVAEFLKQAFGRRHSTPIGCMSCREPFIKAPPQGFAITRPFTHPRQAMVLGICQACAERCSDEELAEILGACLNRARPGIEQIEGGHA